MYKFFTVFIRLNTYIIIWSLLMNNSIADRIKNYIAGSLMYRRIVYHFISYFCIYIHKYIGWVQTDTLIY